ncbi:MAG: metalloregulator ArsR/SmtB family transcription factor [Mariprofundus sp.]|nr:metalloregulator ArsR/SmtB family transcription factor [Mariprofundus sp.]
MGQISALIQLGSKHRTVSDPVIEFNYLVNKQKVIFIKNRYGSLMDLLSLFKALSDPVRLRVIHLLALRDELCVCHLTDALSLPQSTISRHLNILRNSAMVETERRGTWVYYRLMRSSDNVTKLAAMILVSAISDEQLQSDHVRLKELSC